MEGGINSTANNLINLSKLLKHVYIKLETKRPELKLSMEKLARQISQSIQKVYGTVTLTFPELPKNKTDDELIKDVKVVSQLESSIVSLFHRFERLINSRWNGQTQLNQLSRVKRRSQRQPVL